jgi:hypothetical protein
MVHDAVIPRSFCCITTRLSLLILLVVGLYTIPLNAQVNTTWTDGTGNWSNPANWSDGVPNGTYGQFNAFIGNGSSPNPLANLDINANINGLSLNSAGVLMEPGTNLTLANLNLSGSNSFLTGATGGESLLFYGSTGSYSGISGPGTVSNVNLTVFGVPFFAITNGATVSTSGAFANNGFGDDQFTLSNGSTLNVNGGFRTCCNLTITSSQMNVQGTWEMNNAENNYVSVSSGSTVNVKGDFVSCCFVAGIVVSNGSVLNVGGNFNNLLVDGDPGPNALAAVNGSAINVGGNYTSQGLLAVNIDSGSAFRVKGNLNNLTTLNPVSQPQVPSLVISNGSVLSVGKDLTNSGVFSLTTGSMGTVQGALNNSGSVSVDNSSVLRVNSGFDQTAGSTVIDGILDARGPGVNVTGGTLGGTGLIHGNVMMGGTITPGSAGTPGVLTIAGNYQQTSTGVLSELIGLGSHGVLDVKGTAGLGSGVLNITLLGGFDPVGDKLDIMNYKSLSGGFSNGTSFVADGYDWTLNYGSKDVVLTAVSTAETPEPSTLVFLAAGGLLFGLIEFLRRRA